MGVLSGDILVPVIPVTIQIAFFAQYHFSEGENRQINILLRLLIDDAEIGNATVDASVPEHMPITALVLPKSNFSFEKEATLQILASVSGGQEEVLVTKKVRKQPSA
jgi:hypothetical protein